LGSGTKPHFHLIFFNKTTSKRPSVKTDGNNENWAKAPRWLWQGALAQFSFLQLDLSNCAEWAKTPAATISKRGFSPILILAIGFIQLYELG
jgi:hypothetical protein